MHGENLKLTAEYVNIYTTIPPAGCENREYEKLCFVLILLYFKHFNNFYLLTFNGICCRRIAKLVMTQES
jgi:hypothetical protein